MNRHFARSTWVIGFLAVLAAGICGASETQRPRRFHARDSIELARFTQSALVSPDGRYIATVTERGRIEQDVTEGKVWLFDTSVVRQAINQPNPARIEPTILVRMSASINGGTGLLGHGLVITRMKWESGSESLLFLGRDGSENRRLFRVSLRDRKLSALSLPTQDVIDYAAAGRHIAYLAGPAVTPEKAWWSNDPSVPDIVSGSRLSLWEMLFPNYRTNARYMPTEFELWQTTGEIPAPVLDDTTWFKPIRVLGSYSLGAMSLSHDGSKLILVAHVDRVPKLWESYEVPEGLDYWRYRATPDGEVVSLSDRENDYAWPLQYQIVDLKHGTRHALIESPVADFQRAIVDRLQVAWSTDDRAVAVTGTFLPLEPGAIGLKRPCGTAVIQLPDGHADCLVDHATPETGPVTHVSWDEGHHRLFVQSSASQIFEYNRRIHRWSRTSGHPHTPPSEVEVTIQQDLNTPPVLTATDRHSRRSAMIFDPNPQLEEIALGNVSVYTWKSARGLSATGELAKPPHFVPGHRYPLVIQAHGFSRDPFFLVGFESERANAGRALAARGILVLQVREPHSPAYGTWREATQRGTEVYLGAINQLAADGLVDPGKVGITGDALAGGFVAKAITEAPERFAAAALVNTDPGSQFGYYTHIDNSFPDSRQRGAEFFAGSLPYGSGLQHWLERAPGFNTDKIRAAVLVSAGDPQYLLSLWPLYAPLIDQHKPVELQYIRNGQHDLTQPLEVLARQEMLVDWFDFWLNGHEIPDVAKADQYARWRRLRETLMPDRNDN